MTIDKLEVFSYPSILEKKLRFNLINNIEQYGFEKTFSLITENTQTLLNINNIESELLDIILLKNYIITQHTTNPKTDIQEIENNTEINIINKFNILIKDNDFYKAYNLYKDNQCIFNYLCLSYLRNLNENNISLLYKIPKNKISKVYNKLIALENAKLYIYKKQHQKILKK